MNKRFWCAVVLALAVAACNRTPTATSVLQDAQQAMGNPATIQYSGAGMNAFFGQALTAGEEWPRREMGSYIKTINYDQKSARDEMSFTMPVFGGQMQNMQVNGDKAWNVGPAGPVPQFAGSGAYPVLSPADERQLHIWLTPHGFLKGALAAGDATLTEGEGYNMVSFTALGKYKLDGTIDGESHVTRVETTIPNPVLGDTKLAANYSAYRDFNGIQFPGKIQIDQGGFPLWDLNITTVTPCSRRACGTLPAARTTASLSSSPITRR
jgi:hypothetical protein